MNCRLPGLLFALALLSGGCAAVPDDPEIRRDALLLVQGKTKGFFGNGRSGCGGEVFSPFFRNGPSLLLAAFRNGTGLDALDYGKAGTRSADA